MVMRGERGWFWGVALAGRGRGVVWVCGGLVGLVVWGGLGVGLVRGQEPANPAASPVSVRQAAKKKSELTAAFLAKFNAGEDAGAEGAEALARKLVELDEFDYIARYNLAAVLARSRDAEKVKEAEGELKNAVERGFVEFDLMARDRNLVPLRGTATFRALLAKWPEVQERVIDQRLQRKLEELPEKGKGYTTSKDAASRIAILSGLPERSLSGAIEEMRRVERYWETHILPEGQGALSADEKRPDPWVLVFLPTPKDYQRWAMERLGTVQVGGIYNHDEKQLVAQNLGPLLRHEYSHVLHWRHMMRTGFVQPLWVQEGLCSLAEDLGPGSQGNLSALTNWRSNMLRKLAKANRLPKWEELWGVNEAKFMESRGLANYAAARGIFLFLSEEGKLRDWYSAYVRNNTPVQNDRDGQRAFEEVFGMPIKEVQQRWRLWAQTLAEAPEGGVNVRFGLSVGLEDAGDGLRVNAMPDGNALRAGIRVNDVILTIGGKAVRDMTEYARVISAYKQGDEVEVEYRRSQGQRGQVVGKAVLRVVELAE